MSMKSKRPISPKTETMLPACRQNASSLWPKKLITDLGPALQPVARAIARSTQPAGYRFDRGLGQSKAANSAFGVSFDGRVCNCFSRKHALSNNLFGPVRVFVFDKPEHDHFA
jgi:hypothetical protein